MNFIDLFFSQSLKKKFVLIIEDDEQIASILTDFIKSCNYDAQSAPNGDLGLKLTQKNIPDLVLLDITLPNMSGIDVLTRIKSESKTKDIPVIMCTALKQLNEVETCCKLGAEGYITKPFDLERVYKMIKPYLENPLPIKALSSK